MWLNQRLKISFLKKKDTIEWNAEYYFWIYIPHYWKRFPLRITRPVVILTRTFYRDRSVYSTNLRRRRKPRGENNFKKIVRTFFSRAQDTNI